MAAPTLSERIDAFDAAIEIARRRFDPTDIDTATAIVDRVRARAGHGSDHTVVALAGSTGVGKSSLFNEIVGVEVSTPGIRRPTTSVIHGAVWGGGASALLDWLEVPRRHRVETSVDEPLAGLVLVDLPDFDSTEVANRAEVDRLVELVDGLVWVTDPQKYADEVFHDDYVRPLATYGDVMWFVINKIDTVPTDGRTALVDDLRGRLVADGLANPEVTATSVVTGDGLDAVHTLLAEIVSARRAMVARSVSDLRGAVRSIHGDLPAPVGDGDGLSERDRRAFVERLGEAAGVDRVGDVVAAQHRHDARAAMGWPPAKLLSRWRRRHPIADLPRASASAAAASEIDLALRDVAESVDVGARWRRALRSVARDHAMPLRTQLTSVVDGAARDAVGSPNWWRAVQTVQRVLTVAVLAGAAWLITAALLGGFFGFDTDPLLIDTPGAAWIPLPSLLVLGGLAVGLLLALVVRWPVGWSARRRGRRVRSRLMRRIRTLADESVFADLDQAVDDRRRFDELLRTASI